MKKYIILLFLFIISCSKQIRISDENKGLNYKKEVVDISLDVSDIQTANLLTSENTTSIIDILSNSISDDSNSFSVKLIGLDFSKMTIAYNANSVNVALKNISGLSDSYVENNSFFKSYDNLFKAVDLSMLRTIPLDSITPIMISNSYLILRVEDSIANILKSRLNSNNKLGILKLVLEFIDNSDSKLSKTIDIYVLVKRVIESN